MPYTPDPVNAAQPADSEFAGTAAAEFRALKGSINAIRSYLGPQASNPTTDLQGNALVSGDFYYNTTSYNFLIYDAAAVAWRVFQNTATWGLVTSTPVALSVATPDTLTIAMLSNTTITDSLPDGANKLLSITNTGGYTMTWPAGIKWVNALTPTLGTTGVTFVNVFKIASVLYGVALGGAV